MGGRYCGGVICLIGMEEMRGYYYEGAYFVTAGDLVKPVPNAFGGGSEYVVKNVHAHGGSSVMGNI